VLCFIFNKKTIPDSLHPAGNHNRKALHFLLRHGLLMREEVYDKRYNNTQKNAGGNRNIQVKTIFPKMNIPGQFSDRQFVPHKKKVSDTCQYQPRYY
jgi:hypothetical protein